jgi:hypothetical protein
VLTPRHDDSWVDALIAGAGSLALDADHLEALGREARATTPQPRVALIKGALDALR